MNATPTRRTAGRRSAAVADAMQINPEEFKDVPAAEAARTPQRAGGRKIPWRERMRRTGTEDKFAIPEHLKNPDMAYQWVAASLYGQEQEQHLSEVQEFGAWQPVPADREGWGKIGKKAGRSRNQIEIDGLVLHERPKELDNEARQEDLEAARGIRKTQMQRIGLTPKNNMDRTVTAARRSFEAYQAPEE